LGEKEAKSALHDELLLLRESALQAGLREDTKKKKSQTNPKYPVEFEDFSSVLSNHLQLIPVLFSCTPKKKARWL
jgi:hypothetical protein